MIEQLGGGRMIKTLSVMACVWVAVSLLFIYLNLVLDGNSHLNMRLNHLHCSVDKRNIQYFLRKGMSCYQIKHLVPEERFRVHCGDVGYCERMFAGGVD